jgi:hypothetical protein
MDEDRRADRTHGCEPAAGPVRKGRVHAGIIAIPRPATVMYWEGRRHELYNATFSAEFADELFKGGVNSGIEMREEAVWRGRSELPPYFLAGS